MNDLCCRMLESMSRRYFAGVPETDLPDAEIEFRGDGLMGQPTWLLRAHWGEFVYPIKYCPWCGSELAKLNP